MTKQKQTQHTSLKPKGALFSRRQLLTKTAVLGLGTAGLTPVVFAQTAAPDWQPVGGQTVAQLPGKEGLVLLNDRPINAETPAHLLDDRVTPTKYFFVRNNGIPPVVSPADAAQWTFVVDGESSVSTKSYSLRELQKRFDSVTRQIVLECAGNGRSEFVPSASGNQWTTGAVGCPAWTGVRLRDVLEDCGVKPGAKYIGYEGADKHLSGQPHKKPISRGVPIEKALDPDSLLVWAMNGEPLHPLNGFPLRLIFGGWPASTSGKWLKRIRIRDKVHDGAKMTGYAYRVPREPVAPGSHVAKEAMEIIEHMPVKSLITFPRSGVTHIFGKPAQVRGHAWVGQGQIKQVLISLDFGATWKVADLKPPANRFAWQHFSHRVQFPKKGYYEVWAKAIDSNGRAQPMVVPGWNPKGYLNNACHRVAVQVV